MEAEVKIGTIKTSVVGIFFEMIGIKVNKA